MNGLHLDTTILVDKKEDLYLKTKTDRNKSPLRFNAYFGLIVYVNGDARYVLKEPLPYNVDDNDFYPITNEEEFNMYWSKIEFSEDMIRNMNKEYPIGTLVQFYRGDSTFINYGYVSQEFVACGSNGVSFHLDKIVNDGSIEKNIYQDCVMNELHISKITLEEVYEKLNKDLLLEEKNDRAHMKMLINDIKRNKKTQLQLKRNMFNLLNRKNKT